ncbi:hypothetical protein HXX76_010184 [Chlamydomonas incerta]|uniref:Uncharacterized protein n=1 Tax=Chlamydomonas incerta TaxID=51695 RepID=A0A835T162_CHLIN|nr:hypothetical protein HXX76_010184 [Chlamydomonas incerta]|eukprot:KAG2430085.1 hypothetical protein HXX76_010184 [Chlamydomonas incerta]
MAVLVSASPALAKLLPVVPADSFATLYDPPTYEEKLKQTTLLSELGASFDGIRFLIQKGDTLIPSLSSLLASIPANLTVEPGLSNLALATQAYLALYGGPSQALFALTQVGRLVPLNSFYHLAIPFLASGGQTPIGNGVSLYSYSAYTLVNGPLLLEVPPYNGGYWLIPFYDVYGLTYYVLGSAHGNNGGGKWLLVHKDWQWTGEEALPEDLDGIIRSPTLEGNILGRTSFNGTGAAQWNLKWALGPWAPGARPDPVALPPVGLGWGYPDQRPEALWAVNAADPLAFWRLAGDIFRRNGGPSVPTPLIKALPRLGILPDYGFVPYGLSANVTDALALAPLLANRILVAKYTFLGAPATNYWKLPVYDGDWGNDYVLGAAIMKGFWISNFLKDAAYYYLYVDASAQTFNGTADYTITFPATPPATSEAFWSLQALDLDEWTLIFGPSLANLALSSATPGLYIAPNGSIPIRISPRDPPANTTAASRGWNWVKAYPGHYHLLLRVYAGDASVQSNTYVPPPVFKLPPAAPGAASPAPTPAPVPTGGQPAASNSTSGASPTPSA